MTERLTTSDRYRLQRFVDAQQTIYAQARAELTAGEKRSHWMWFIFPQVEGLGSSSMAQRYAISGLPEAAAYLEHPLLGPRLRECAELVKQHTGSSISDIFGYPDDLKFFSSITLFAETAKNLTGNGIFAEVLESRFGGKRDGATLSRLGR